MKLLSAKALFKEQGAIDISPLIDMVFILLVFFVVTSAFVQERGLAMDTPNGGEIVPSEAEKFGIELTKDRAVRVNGEVVALANLLEHLKRRVARGDEMTQLIVSESVPAQLTVSVLDLCYEAGIEAVVLSEVTDS